MNSEIFKINFDPSTKIITGKVIVSKLDKQQAKTIHEMTVNAVNEYSDYKDYILDISEIIDENPESIGYMVKTSNIVKKTAGYMVLVIREEIVQKFMLTNPEMFDLFAVFFNLDDAVKFVISKR